MRKHRLKAKGLCQQGIIPDFYGVIERIDLQTLPPPWQPYPCAFLKDKLLPPPQRRPHRVHPRHAPDRLVHVLRGEGGKTVRSSVKYTPRGSIMGICIPGT